MTRDHKISDQHSTPTNDKEHENFVSHFELSRVVVSRLYFVSNFCFNWNVFQTLGCHLSITINHEYGVILNRSLASKHNDTHFHLHWQNFSILILIRFVLFVRALDGNYHGFMISCIDKMRVCGFLKKKQSLNELRNCQAFIKQICGEFE